MNDKLNIIVYGLGRDYCEHKEFIENKYEVIGVTDSDLSKKTEYSNFIIKEDLLNLDYDRVLICSENYYDEIKADLVGLGIDRHKIIGLDGNVVHLKNRDPIIVVKFMGGMGNLMFQYAFYLKLMIKNTGIPVKADISWYFLESSVSAFQVPWVFERIFNLKLPIATIEEIAESRRQEKYFEKELSSYDQKAANINAGYISGYWQTSKYFEEVEKEVRKAFQFDPRYLSNRQKKNIGKN